VANPAATLEGLKQAAFAGLIHAPSKKNEEDGPTLAKVNYARIKMRKREGWVERNGTQLLSSTFNIGNALRMLGIKVHYNALRNTIELSNTGSPISRDTKSPIYDGDLSDEAVTFIKGRIALAFGFEVGWDKLWKAIAEKARRAAYHPIRDWLNTLKWDGVKRADGLLPTYLGTNDSPYERAISKATMLSLVTKVFVPGYPYDILPVIEGKQGILKSTALRTLVSAPWYGEAISFFTLTTKEVMEVALGKWLLELSELSGLRSKKDSDHIKAQLSVTHDRARPAYGRATVEMGRQWTPVSTTNSSRYLVFDEDGEHRRFYPTIAGVVHEIEIDKLTQDREQLFAEAMVLYRNGERPHIPRELWDEGRQQQKEREADDPYEMLIDAWAEKLPGKLNDAMTDEAMALKDAKVKLAKVRGQLEAVYTITYGKLRGTLDLDENDALKNSSYSRVLTKTMTMRLGWKRGMLNDGTRVFWLPAKGPEVAF
jgi:hypothetical protein